MASSTARGYGANHKRAREQALAQLARRPGSMRCHFCGKVLRLGDDLHLDHTPDRRGYRGLTCASCNIADGSNRRWAKSKAKPAPSGTSYPIART